MSQDDYTKIIPYAVSTGNVNTYAITLNPVPTSLATGMAVCVKINVANTSTSTLNINNLGAKTIKKSNGSTLSNGNLKASGIYTFRYDGLAFILQGEGGEYGTAGASNILEGFTFGTENGLINGTIPTRATTNIAPMNIAQSFLEGYYSGFVVAPNLIPTYTNYFVLSPFSYKEITNTEIGFTPTVSIAQCSTRQQYFSFGMAINGSTFTAKIDVDSATPTIEGVGTFRLSNNTGETFPYNLTLLRELGR